MNNAKLIKFHHPNNEEMLYYQKAYEIAEKKRREQIRRDLIKGYLKIESDYQARLT